jgi:hypothetical protein
MTDHAAEVARIKAEFAARDAAWMAVITPRLATGPATTGELAEACGVGRGNKTFRTFLAKQRNAGVLVVIGTKPGPSGWPNSEWGLP